MNKDKILTTLAAGLLGYYLSISVFRHFVWDLLYQALPPINHRHLPQLYTGLFGAVVGGTLGYMLFLRLIEKKSFRSGRKQYFIALMLMIIVPFIIAGAFRVHSVRFVEKAEHTVPTSIRITEESEDASIMFEESMNTAGGLSKQCVPKKENFAAWGKWIAELQLEKAIDREEYEDKSIATLWVEYDVDGKWYSKIMRFDGEFFIEDAGDKMAFYKNQALANALEDILYTAKDIKQYKGAVIVNVDTHQEKEKQIEVSGEDFQEMVRALNEENQIEPDAKIFNRFESLKGRRGLWIPKTEKDIYGIFLYGTQEGREVTENFMIYDRQTGILKFEGQYYRADFMKKHIL